MVLDMVEDMVEEDGPDKSNERKYISKLKEYGHKGTIKVRVCKENIIQGGLIKTQNSIRVMEDELANDSGVQHKNEECSYGVGAVLHTQIHNIGRGI